MKTKHILLTSFLLVSGMMASVLQAQDKWSLGPRVGVNFSNVSNVDDSKSATGLALGLSTTYSINESNGITLDLLYSAEGYKASNEEYNLNYLQVPIYFDFFFGKLGESFRPKAYLGVVPGFYLGGKLNDVDVNDDFFRKFMFAASAGIGFNYRIGSRIWLNTDVRSYIGLADVRDEDFVVGDGIKPRNVQLSLGVCYGISKLD